MIVDRNALLSTFFLKELDSQSFSYYFINNIFTNLLKFTC
jgi:hypothetical protein